MGVPVVPSTLLGASAFGFASTGPSTVGTGDSAQVKSGQDNVARPTNEWCGMLCAKQVPRRSCSIHSRARRATPTRCRDSSSVKATPNLARCLVISLGRSATPGPTDSLLSATVSRVATGLRDAALRRSSLRGRRASTSCQPLAVVATISGPARAHDEGRSRAAPKRHVVVERVAGPRVRRSCTRHNLSVIDSWSASSTASGSITDDQTTSDCHPRAPRPRCPV